MGVDGSVRMVDSPIAMVPTSFHHARVRVHVLTLIRLLQGAKKTVEYEQAMAAWVESLALRFPHREVRLPFVPELPLYPRLLHDVDDEAYELALVAIKARYRGEVRLWRQTWPW